MSLAPASAVREILLDHLDEGLQRSGLTQESVTDDTDFFAEQLIYSFGLLELILALEQRFDVAIDFEAVETDDFTMVGPFCSIVEQLSAAA